MSTSYACDRYGKPAPKGLPTPVFVLVHVSPIYHGNGTSKDLCRTCWDELTTLVRNWEKGGP